VAFLFCGCFSHRLNYFKKILNLPAFFCLLDVLGAYIRRFDGLTLLINRNRFRWRLFESFTGNGCTKLFAFFLGRAGLALLTAF
jgi:hypothetical protein